MASDYQKIIEENSQNPPINYRRILTPYSDRTHFVYELVQNADDNRSQCIGLQLCEDGLLVWNDGCQFSEEDVRSICSIGFSNKDLTQIGTFGMGFKAVYTYTDIPEVYSGDERFRLPIKNPTIPEVIDIDEINTRVVGLLEKGRTVFWLPFREDRHLETEIKRLRDCLSNLEKRSLLFLRKLRAVQWHDQSNGQKGIYFCQRSPYKKMQNASKIALKASVNGNNQSSEKFLVFRKEVQPPQEVIIELQKLSEDEEQRERIQRSADKLQPVEVAFKLQDERIIEMDSCVLFAYLPTQVKTNLRFLIQARYQTTPARDNISIDNPWNNWLMRETVDFLPEILEKLREKGLLTPAFFNVFPLKNDEVPDEYESISKSLQKALQDHPYVPTQNGKYAKAENVRYPHTESLYQLLKSDWMSQVEWLDPEIRNTEEFRRCFMAMREAGVKEAQFVPILNWLKKRPEGWFNEMSDGWLRSLYLYLNEQKSKINLIKELPLVRLGDGSHICASKSPVFFPPDTAEEREEITSFTNELPIVKSTLLEGNEGNDIKTFLKNIGVKTMQPEHLIRGYILPKYHESDSIPNVEQNRSDLRFLRHFFSKVSGAERSRLSKEIAKAPILLVYNEDDREILYFLAPCNTYLSKAYTSDASLETYFSGCNNVWYVDENYIDDNTDQDDWCRFLKRLDVLDIPRVYRENGQSHLHGLPEALEKISRDKDKNLSLTLWHLLIKVSSFDVISCSYLKETAWIPDEHGDFYCPSACFDPTNENRNVLGNSVVYLHPDFDISEDNIDARLLAEKLGIHLNANTESVMNYLQTLSGSNVDIEDIEPLYLFLSQQNVSFSDMFKEEHLIYTPNQETCWWKSNEVFWEDESVVFGNNRGYLGAYYQEELKAFFTALGVTERAAPLDYVRSIQDVASIAKTDDLEFRERIAFLYGRLWQFLKEGGSSLENEEWQEKWKETRIGKYWLGKNGDKWEFFSVENLIRNDDPYIAKIFDGTIPFWGFSDDLLDLAEYLEIESCSQATVIFKPIGKQEEDLDWSVKARDLHPYIHDFLNSPDLCIVVEKEKSVDFLKTLSVRLVEELGTTYTLKTISLTTSDPRPSFLDISDQEVILWIALETDKDDYPLLIGDALQYYFGVKELGRFIEHLLTKEKIKVIDHWKREGLRTELCKSRVESVTKDVPGESQESDNSEVSDSNKENVNGSVIIEDENNSNGVVDPIIPLSDNAPVTKTTEINQSTSESIIIEEEGNENDRYREESQEHKRLKYNLAANPSQFGAGLILVKIEYEFKSKDKVDILLKDSSGHPVPVEVETKYSIESWRDLGVWQAVKYKHLAAVEYGLPCNQVRSILAAPRIPDDVKAKCKELGIEPIEVPLPNDTRNAKA